MPNINERRHRPPHVSQTGKPGTEQEPSIPGNADELNDDQADSGPDRDHKELG
jgi:hypothetical protein